MWGAGYLVPEFHSNVGNVGALDIIASVASLVVQRPHPVLLQRTRTNQKTQNHTAKDFLHDLACTVEHRPDTVVLRCRVNQRQIRGR